MRRPSLSELASFPEHTGPVPDAKRWGDYTRVIPRDLFNEGDLLKCWGKLWIALDKLNDGRVVVDHDGEAFRIVQDETDGSLAVENLRLCAHGRVREVRRPLNSRDPWPLRLTVDDEDVQIFTADGALSGEFIAFIEEN